MRKTLIVVIAMTSLTALIGCCRCEKEPIVAENQALIVPPDFGSMPK